MKLAIHFQRPLVLALCGGAMLLTLSACGGGVPDSSPTGAANEVNEVFLTPTTNADGEREYHADGATITVKEWTPLPSSSAPEPTAVLEEIYLSPVKTGESTYEYRRADGTLAAVWEALSNKPETLPPLTPDSKSVWPLDWEIYTGERFTGSDELEAVDGTLALYVCLTLTPAAEGYLGYLDCAAQTITWLEPPADVDYYLKLTINGVKSIKPVLTQDSEDMIHYSGEFSREPIL